MPTIRFPEVVTEFGAVIVAGEALPVAVVLFAVTGANTPVPVSIATAYLEEVKVQVTEGFVPLLDWQYHMVIRSVFVTTVPIDT